MSFRPTRPLSADQRRRLEVSRWEMPDMSTPPVPPRQAETSGQDAGARVERARPPTAAELEALRLAAREEGHAQGREEGYAEGLRQGEAAARKQAKRTQGEQQAHLKALQELLEALARPLEQADDAVMEQLAELSLVVARHVVRRELQTQPGEVMAVLREAVAALPMAARNVRVHVNPADFRFLSERLGGGGAEGGEQAWRLVEDGAVSRGGCTVRSDASYIDATVEHRLHQLVSQLLGGGRDQDHFDSVTRSVAAPESPDDEHETAGDGSPPAGGDTA